MLGDAPSQTLCADKDGKYYDCLSVNRTYVNQDTNDVVSYNYSGNADWNLVKDYVEQIANSLNNNLGSGVLFNLVELQDFNIKARNQAQLVEFNLQVQGFLVSALSKLGWPVKTSKGNDKMSRDTSWFASSGATEQAVYILGGAIDEYNQGITLHINVYRSDTGVTVAAASGLIPNRVLNGNYQ